MLLKLKNIRTKLLLSFGVFLFFSILIAGVAFFFVRQMLNHGEMKNSLDRLTILMLDARKFEKDFIINEPNNKEFMKSGKSIKADNFALTLISIDSVLKQINNDPISEKLDLKSEIRSIQISTEQYSSAFTSLVQKIKKRGFKDEGMEGEMRKVVHVLENDYSTIIDKASILTLRRHEKDFFLRKDEKYVEKLHKTSEEIIKKSGDDFAILTIIRTYVANFNNIVSIEKEIGFDETHGVRGRLKDSYEEIEPKVLLMQSKVSEYTDRIMRQSVWVISVIIFLFLIIGSALAYYFSYTISTPIIILDRISRSVIRSLKYQEKFLSKINSNDEIGSLAKNFQLMLSKLKFNLKEVEDQNKILLVAAEEEKKQKWSSNGLALMSDMLHKSYSSIEEQCFSIISLVVKYVNANQGAIFVLQDDNKDNIYLELVSSYAYEKRKYIHKQIQPGEGLLGQTFLEGQYTYMTIVPKDYVKITSGLGEATPACILIMPLKANGQVRGMIELASFQVLENYQIQFLEKLGEIIASTLLNTTINHKTNQLLFQSQQLTEELRAQEEEIRQNIEELLATQEHSRRLHEELKNKEEDLLQQISELNDEKAFIELKNKELMAELKLAQTYIDINQNHMDTVAIQSIEKDKAGQRLNFAEDLLARKVHSYEKSLTIKTL